MVIQLVGMSLGITLSIEAYCDPNFFSLNGVTQIVKNVIQANKAKFKFNYPVDELCSN